MKVELDIILLGLVWFGLVCLVNGILTFLCFSLKVNVKARLEFRLTYYDVAFQYITHYARRLLTKIEITKDFSSESRSERNYQFS